MGRKKAEEHAHSESWLVSYCDMISLLCTFFLMMMTFSTSNEHDVREVGIGILRGRGGIWKNPMSFPTQTDVEPQVVTALARDLAQVMEPTDGAPSASVRPLVDGLTISFPLECSFEPGSARVNIKLEKKLFDLSKCLTSYTHLIVIEGFTDSEFKPTSEFADEMAMGFARAQAAAKFLLENSLVATDQLQVSTAGALRPRASNDTPTGRASNRRIEVRIVAIDRPALTTGGPSGGKAR